MERDDLGRDISRAKKTESEEDKARMKVEEMRKKYSTRVKEVKREFRESAPVFYKGVETLVLPRGVFFDKEVPHVGVRIFAVWWDYWLRKRKNPDDPFTFVSLHKVAEALGIYYGYAFKVVKRMEKIGWLTTIRRTGTHKTNIIVLHEKKGMKISKAQKERFKKTVAEYEESWIRRIAVLTD